MRKLYKLLRLAASAAAALPLLLPASANAAAVINNVRPWRTDSGLEDVLPARLDLYNSGPASWDATGWAVASPDWSVALPSWIVPPKSYLRLVLDSGVDDADFSDSVGTFHAGSPNVLDRAAGELGLYSGPPAAATLADFVNWGMGSSSFGSIYAQSQTVGQWPAGQYVDLTGDEGFSTIGRTPSGHDTNIPANWSEVRREWLELPVPHTPLQWLPRNGVLLPAVTTLLWKPVSGAVIYQVEVDNDSTFTSPEASQVIFGATTATISIADGDYYWRVRPNVPTGAPPAVWRFAQGTPSAALTFGYSVVPQYYQHKDARLLCIWHLQNQFNAGGANTRPGCTEAAGAAGPWDAAHATDSTHIVGCPHCSWYCTRCSIQMICHKFGGSLLQDEISYHFWQNANPGPEGDLGHNRGAWPERNATYSWALSGAAIGQTNNNPDAAIPWATIIAQITADRPILMVINNSAHTVVLNGYFVGPATGNHYIHINDPWPGSSGWFIHAGNATRWYTLPAGAVAGRATDANVATDDDGDGVVNFDEQHPDPASGQVARTFCSLHNDPDTEDDEVWDKEEIRSYTFHDGDHAGHNNDALLFPDGDGDGLRQECDCDGDNDSDFDGGEDINGDGHNPVGGLETCEYNPDHLINCGVVLFPGPVLCTEDVYLFGMTYHQFSWYPYEVTSPCIPPVDGQGIGWSGIVFSAANGIIPLQYIGTYSPGSYRVIVDVLRDHLYSEPDNWDPWTCWGVPYHCYLIIKTPDLTYSGDFYIPVLDSLNIRYDITYVTPGTDGPTVAQMAPYFVVIYVTGNTPAGACLTPNDAANLMQYLDQGGKLLITGDNIGTEAALFPDPQRMQFYNQYLGAQYIQEYPSCPVAVSEPASFLSPIPTFQVQGGDGANYPDRSPDDVAIVPSAGSFSAAQWAPFCPPPPSSAVIGNENPATMSRSAYYAFPWESASSFQLRRDLMDLTLDWLYGTPPPLPAVDDLTIMVTTSGVRLNWTPVDGAMNYEIHASPDPNFLPSDATQIGLSVDSFFDIFYTVDLPPMQAYAVVVTAPAFGGGGHGGGLTQATRAWLAQQTDPEVVKTELARRKIKFRMFTSPSQE